MTLKNELKDVDVIFQTGEVEPSSDIKGLIEEYRNARLNEKKLRDDLEAASELRMQIEERLYKSLENQGLDSVKVDGVSFYRNDKFFAYTDEEGKAKLLEWLHEIDGDGIISPENVNSKRLSSFIKERLQNGLDVPVFVKTFLRPKIGYRKS